MRAVPSVCLCLRCIWEHLCRPSCIGNYHQPPEQRDLEEVLACVLGSSDRCLHTGFKSAVSSSDSRVYHWHLLFSVWAFQKMPGNLSYAHTVPDTFNVCCKVKCWKKSAASPFMLLDGHLSQGGWFFSSTALDQCTRLDPSGAHATCLAPWALPGLWQKLESVQESGRRLKEEEKGWGQCLMVEVFKSSQTAVPGARLSVRC